MHSDIYIRLVLQFIMNPHEFFMLYVLMTAGIHTVLSIRETFCGTSTIPSSLPSEVGLTILNWDKIAGLLRHYFKIYLFLALPFYSTKPALRFVLRFAPLFLS